MFQFEGLLELIEQYAVITLFRHEHPDCDAVGSQFGLKNWILDNWPDKKVYALGNEYCEQGNCWPESDSCLGSEIEESLAIILDTANTARMDDRRGLKAAKVVRIDHHPKVENFGDICYIYPSAASTCELLGDFFRQNEQDVSLKTAEYLFRGILTDTLSFRTSSTTSYSLDVAGWLARFGVRFPELNRQLFDQPLERFKFANMLRSSVQIRDEKLAYRIVSIKEMEEWGMEAQDVKNFIEEFGGVREFEVYGIFCQKLVNGEICYDGSIRSKHVIINGIAQRHKGGGHPNACGVKNLTNDELNHLLNALYQAIFGQGEIGLSSIEM